MKNKVLYEELRPQEFVDKINECPVAYLPLGTLEWHSYHLPLGADGLQAMGVFKEIARKSGGIVLPMLFLGPDLKVTKDDKEYYGMDSLSFEDGNPQQLEGSAYYIPDDHFTQLLDRILENLSRAGFKAVVAHGHGPSTNQFKARKEYFKEKFGLETFTLFDLGYPEDEGIQTDHAATNETSLVMALRPELADLSAFPKNQIPVAVWGKDPRVYASKKEGKRLIKKNVEKVCKMLDEITMNLRKEKRLLNYTKIKSLLR